MGLRILHTVQFYHPHVGGSEHVVRLLSERLAERGHQVTVATSTHRQRPPDAVLNGVRVVGFDIQGNAARGMKGDVGRYRQFVLDGAFDVMMNYAAQAWPTDAVSGILSSFAGVRVLVPCGYSGLGDHRYRDYFARLPGVLRCYDHVVYLSASYQDKAYGDRHGIAAYSIVPNAADEREQWADAGDFRSKHGLGHGVLVLCVANHLRSKGHLDLIRAFRRAATGAASLVIVGEPGVSSKRWTGCYDMCRLQAVLSRGSVTMLSGLARREVVQAFAAADLFAMASKVECSPLVLFESMASGTPWLCTNVGNVSELPGGEVASDLSEFEARLASMLGDASKRQRIGDAGRAAWREHYTFGAMVDTYEKLYAELAERRTHRSAEAS